MKKELAKDVKLKAEKLLAEKKKAIEQEQIIKKNESNDTSVRK